MIISTMRTTREIMNSCHVHIYAILRTIDWCQCYNMNVLRRAQACPGLPLPRATSTVTSMQMAESGCGGCIVHTRTVGPLIYISRQKSYYLLALMFVTIMYTYIIFS